MRLGDEGRQTRSASQAPGRISGGGGGGGTEQCSGTGVVW
jgi:hypothetical protein